MQRNYGSFIRERAIKNLLSAQEKIAEAGNAKAIIILTKFILNVSHKFDQELLELGLSVPQVTQIFLKLRQMGLDIPADVYTIPYAVKTIQKALAAKQAGEVQ